MRIGIKNYWAIRDAFVVPFLAVSFSDTKCELAVLGFGIVIWRL